VAPKLIASGRRDDAATQEQSGVVATRQIAKEAK
jgi:hypothetical protein